MKYPARRRAIAAELRAIRKTKGMSQRELSAALGEVHNYCHYVETSQLPISGEQIMAWVEKCGDKASTLFQNVERRLHLK